MVVKVDHEEKLVPSLESMSGRVLQVVFPVRMH
jgi:hypothetical protein